jgi:REP-associated tyrosine transposase
MKPRRNPWDFPTILGHDHMTQKTGGTGFPACGPEEELTIRRRNLPHWHMEGSTYFITFRLRSGSLSSDERRIVLDAIKHFHQVRYWVTATVVMPDHVHLLLTPLTQESGYEYPLGKILQGIKGFSAREINKLRLSKGNLWMDENYDRIIRDFDEYLEKWHYLRNNPVKDGIRLAPEEYPFLWEPGELLENHNTA